ncbi:MAG: hypothetical protein ACRDTT_02565, partial [Pseudonocardiaceae bacterium]
MHDHSKSASLPMDAGKPCSTGYGPALPVRRGDDVAAIDTATSATEDPGPRTGDWRSPQYEP